MQIKISQENPKELEFVKEPVKNEKQDIKSYIASQLALQTAGQKIIDEAKANINTVKQLGVDVDIIEEEINNQ